MTDERGAGLERAAKRHAAAVQSAGLATPRAFYDRGGCVMMLPQVYVGGAERAMISIMRATLGLVRWRGFAVVGRIWDAAIRREMEDLAPVAIGPDACREMIDGADVVVSWAILDLPFYLPDHGRRPKVVGMSHSTSDSPWAVAVMTDDRGIDSYVAVSTPAISSIPPSRRSDAVVIPNALDFSRLEITKSREEVRREWGLPGGAKVLGGLHRISDEKYPDGMIAAIKELPPEWFGVIVGEGYDRPRVDAMIASEAPGRVLTPGARLDAGNVLDAFDVALVASDYESFCLSLAEACAVGCPVVGTHVGVAVDHPWIVAPIPVRASGAEIAAAVLADMENPSRQDRVRRAKELASSEWSPKSIGAAWSDLIANCTNCQRSTGTLTISTVVVETTRRQRAKACQFRGCKTGCRHSICNKFHREVHFDECMRCEESDLKVSPSFPAV